MSATTGARVTQDLAARRVIGGVGTTSSQAARVVIADPHPAFIDGLTATINADDHLEVIATLAELDRLEAIVHGQQPDAALVGFDLWPTGSVRISPELIETLATATRLILVYDQIDSHHVWHALHSRVCGILSRGNPTPTFVHAVNQAVLNGVYLDATIQNELAQLVQRTHGTTSTTLTRRELAVLRLCADGQHNEQISERLQLSTATIKATLQDIYEKLAVHDRAAAVAQALRRGIIS